MTFLPGGSKAARTAQRLIVSAPCPGRQLGRLFVDVFPAIAETILGVGTWHVLFSVAQGAILAAYRIRRHACSAAPVSHGIEWNTP